MGEFDISELNLAIVLLAVLVLYVALRRLRAVVVRLPLTRTRRALVRKARPLIELLLLSGFIILSVRLVLKGDDRYSAAVLGLIVVGVVAISWSSLRDLLAGLLIKTSELFLPGDFIEVDGVGGWVTGLGYRVIALETPEGDQVFVRYSRITASTVVRKPAADGVFRHTFEVEIPPGAEDVELRDAIRERALYAHWSSVAREPQIRLARDGVMSVTVFSVGYGQGPLIERSVRRGLERWARLVLGERGEGRGDS